jgi:hypothetical protein
MSNPSNESPAPVTSLAVERGRAQLEHDDQGNFKGATGPDGVNLYRLLMIKSGMELEARTNGKMRLTRKAPSCFVIAKREHNLKGSKLAIYTAYCEMHGFEVKPDVVAKLSDGSKAAARKVG